MFSSQKDADAFAEYFSRARDTWGVYAAAFQKMARRLHMLQQRYANGRDAWRWLILARGAAEQAKYARAALNAALGGEHEDFT